MTLPYGIQSTALLNTSYIGNTSKHVSEEFLFLESKWAQVFTGLVAFTAIVITCHQVSLFTDFRVWACSLVKKFLKFLIVPRVKYFGYS